MRNLIAVAVTSKAAVVVRMPPVAVNVTRTGSPEMLVRNEPLAIPVSPGRSGCDTYRKEIK